METVGLVGVGKIGLPIAENLIKSGYRVLGYRRSSLAEFEKTGGIPARSVALYDKFMEMGFGEKDVAAMVDVIGALPPAKGKR
jgi:lactate dehydrogenase-like 2-hydroxyacid dehydrogenase